MKKRLTKEQELFCVEYVKTLKPAASYIVAYDATNVATNVASKRACSLLNNQRVAAQIQLLRNKAAKKQEFSVTEVLRHWVNIATANPADLIAYQRRCCRHCYGINNNYQWNEMEFATQCAQAISDRKLPPTASGGFGFRPDRDPVISCNNCYGEGVQSVFVADTRNLKGKAKFLYAGLKQTRDGVQVLMRDQDEALRNISKYLGMDKKRVELTGADGLPLMAISNITNDPIEAANIYKKIMGA